MFYHFRELTKMITNIELFKKRYLNYPWSKQTLKGLFYYIMIHSPQTLFQANK